MASKTLETWLYNGQEYVTPKAAARYLGIEHKALLREITKGRLKAARIESRQLIELDTLNAYAANQRPKPRRRGRGEKWI